MPVETIAPYAVAVRFPVRDYDEWRTHFDQVESARREAGALGHHVNRVDDDPNEVIVYLALSDLERMQAFASSAELRDIMQRAGVVGPPDFTWMTPVREAAVQDRELPAFMLTHRVADFDRWLEGYDAADELRREHGIIGHAAARSLGDPAIAIVYHQAETFEELEQFLNLAELKEAMQQAGVISEPDVVFCIGGPGKAYD